MKTPLYIFVLPFALVGLLACGSTDPGSSATGGAGGTGGNDGIAGHGGDAATGGNGGDGATGGNAGNGGSPSDRRIFVTSAVQTAGLGGIAGADEICATEAADANLQGEFKAWLSTTSSSVADRLSHDGGPFVRVDEMVVANDWADLVDGALLAPINLDANGQPRTGDVWTGTLETGASYTVDDCVAFTSGDNADGHAYCGSSTSTTATWTYNQRAACASTLRLYCVEQ